MSTLLEILPSDMVVEILNRLTVPELLTVFQTNAALNHRYRRLFEERIKDYRLTIEALEAARPAVQQSIERAIASIMSYYLPGTGYLRACLLSPELTRVMGLGNFYKVGDRAIYTSFGLLLWWGIYIRRNGLDILRTIQPDSLIDSLFTLTANQTGYQPGVPFPQSDLIRYLTSLIDCNTPIIITPEIVEALYQENYELGLMSEQQLAHRYGGRIPLSLPGITPLQ